MNYPLENLRKLDHLEKRIESLLKGEMPIGARLMAELCLSAVEAGRRGNYPVASALVGSSQKLEFRANNQSFAPNFKSSGHAEMLTLDQWEDSDEPSMDVSLFTTLEPCLMCTARICMSRVRSVTYLTPDPSAGALTCRIPVTPDLQPTLAKIQFQKLETSLDLSAIGIELYNLGEELWLNKKTSPP